jgi:hypothetical protein
MMNANGARQSTRPTILKEIRVNQVSGVCARLSFTSRRLLSPNVIIEECALIYHGTSSFTLERCSSIHVYDHSFITSIAVTQQYCCDIAININFKKGKVQHPKHNEDSTCTIWSLGSKAFKWINTKNVGIKDIVKEMQGGWWYTLTNYTLTPQNKVYSVGNFPFDLIVGQETNVALAPTPEISFCLPRQLADIDQALASQKRCVAVVDGSIVDIDFLYMYANRSVCIL